MILYVIASVHLISVKSACGKLDSNGTLDKTYVSQHFLYTIFTFLEQNPNDFEIMYPNYHYFAKICKTEIR